MPRLYLLPGLLGSEMLNPHPVLPDAVWASWTRLALCHFFYLELAADGVSPAPITGRPCTPGRPLPDYYQPLAVDLRAGLGQLGYQVIDYGYDWRKTAVTTGVQLAAEIASTSSPADPAVIVAHSQGGLIARSAWFQLGLLGRQSHLRRIITLGTPHRGSYGVPVAWSLDDPQLMQLAVVKNLVTLGGKYVPGFEDRPWVSTADLVRALSTWPGLYELLPLLDSQAAHDDPDRERLYTASNWPPDRGISQDWLDYARGPWRTFLLDPASMPPANVLVCVSGNGVNTPARLARPDYLGQARAFEFTELGDGRVTADSALAPNAYPVVGSALHSDLPLSQWVRDGCIRWAPLDLGPPPPPPEVIRGPVVPILGSPPTPNSTGVWKDP